MYVLFYYNYRFNLDHALALLKKKFPLEENAIVPLQLNSPDVGSGSDPKRFKNEFIDTPLQEKSPFINGVPEPDAIYNLLLSSVNVEGPAPNPIAILFEELPEKFNPAFCPNAILFDPDVLVHKAQDPIAVLLAPIVLLFKARHPIAVLLAPVVFLFKASRPSAVLLIPDVLAVKAIIPIAVL